MAVEDRAHFPIRKRPFQSIADFDTDPAIAGGPQQEQSVVLVLLADAPQLEQLDRDLFDRSAVQRLDHDDRHLDPAGALDFVNRGIDARDRVSAERTGKVGDPGPVPGSRVGNAGDRLGAGAHDERGEKRAGRQECEDTERARSTGVSSHSDRIVAHAAMRASDLLSFAASAFGRKTRGLPVSDHYDGERFFNPAGDQARPIGDVITWQRTRERSAWPECVPLTSYPPPPSQVAPGSI